MISKNINVLRLVIFGDFLSISGTGHVRGYVVYAVVFVDVVEADVFADTLTLFNFYIVITGVVAGCASGVVCGC